ncbi:UDP-N-acetylglucosamine 2-epimerase [uncultured Photobacterium sp.]|uniref:UDP-N-acetylglucosamine 2-epimerase n=1 Tax=uncultured Photobacterium sp. TaxID=173973 RepID=UPI002620102F|nr:UDP-N-acetylglucosamine 2-epimerase [uncultured Photobacterium sp.]
MSKNILFLTGTRADFGKLKSLIRKVEETDGLNAHLFVTGMHMLAKYGLTAREVEKSGFRSIYKYINQNTEDSMDVILAKTIHGLSDYVKELKPDLIIVHGDRVEALAGAIVGSLNNILVAHIEGGEVSGTIDELIRHSVSKMSHIHFVCNEEAEKRLLQLGEEEESIFVIGSPDLDIMTSPVLPSLDAVKARYDIPFDDYSLFMYHPVTTDVDSLPKNISNTVDALLASGDNYVVIYPNNDHGSEIIINELKRLEGNPKFRIFPSVRFEYFLVLLKNASYMIGNSSAGVREAPFYGLPSIDLGTRQYNRATANSIINTKEVYTDILHSIEYAKFGCFERHMEFGEGNSDELFITAISKQSFWNKQKQKRFNDI